MGALAGLVDKGLVAPDWAEALAPVDEQIAAMGQFLRAEIAAGRRVPPGGRPHLARLPAAAGGRAGAGRRPGPLPHARPPDRPELRGRRARAAAPAEPAQHLPGARHRPRRHACPRTATSPPGPTAGVMLLNRVLTVRPGEAGLPPRPRLGGGHRPARSTPSPARGGPLAAILWGRDAQSLKPELGAGPLGRVGAPQPAVGAPRLLRLATVQPGQPAARGAGRYAGGLAPAVDQE